ncbi:MAG: glutathione S-transferase C-terminal domain-containing protein [Acidimicrobiales bacterium]
MPRPRRGDRLGDGGRLSGREQRGLRSRVRHQPGRLRSGRTTGCSTGSTGSLERLASRRFLVGDTLTEADVRLFTTLARFDAVYHGHFKCNRKKLTELPVPWAYARDLFQTPGFGDTIDFVQIKQHYYVVHTSVNPTRVVPAGPDLSGWLTPHGREDLGGRPFGDGTPPGPPAPDERVEPDHAPMA